MEEIETHFVSIPPHIFEVDGNWYQVSSYLYHDKIHIHLPNGRIIRARDLNHPDPPAPSRLERVLNGHNLIYATEITQVAITFQPGEKTRSGCVIAPPPAILDEMAAEPGAIADIYLIPLSRQGLQPYTISFSALKRQSHGGEDTAVYQGQLTDRLGAIELWYNSDGLVHVIISLQTQVLPA